jgi:(2Fe-2S) ferredoxin
MNSSHSAMNDDKKKLEQLARGLGIGEYRRHVFLCTGPDCCSPQVGLEAWTALKEELKDRRLDLGSNGCYRTKVGCLRICTQGPTMVVYPEGARYSGMVAARMPILVQEHLVDGQPVKEWMFASNPLAAGGADDNRGSSPTSEMGE